ncbi:MAG: fumarylacetoacetate hydrolase family protein [Burkholderiales bacterium]|nr:fumarylacetoacetate hydrolase family protein [Burkholderiales bacterium]
MPMNLAATHILPADADSATLVGRAWVPGPLPGPSPVVIHAGRAYDLSLVRPTIAELINVEDPVGAVRAALTSGRAQPIGDVAAMLTNSRADARNPDRPYFLTPCDLQALRACGVTFVASMLERVIEEHAKGDPAQAEEIRGTLGREIGASLSAVKPGSAEAMRVKALLVEKGLWSQYLEVGIGPDAEVFNKSQPMSAVGVGADIGVLENSSWNNPEPEVVLAVNNRGKVVGAALGNDVNLRDWEGRSALLLGRAKDNNASCAIGPFIRVLDDGFDIDALRRIYVEVEVVGAVDGFKVEGRYSLTQISRDPLDLASQAIGANHQYPDGLMLFLGTAFAPTQDRGERGHGFTHKVGDIVTVRSRHLGALVNRVDHCHRITPWTFGVTALMRNLSERGLI